ncbi:MAG: FtsX-like permease family protein [Firmicutes bacterium]|nr:FtsX-like permease family protein [Bacillota bacterium]
MLKRSTLREIRNSKERYLAIMAIVALGVGFFSGLKVCKEEMLSTCQHYLEDCNLYDYQIMTSYGIDDESVDIALENEAVADAEAGIEMDYIVETGKDTKAVYKAISMPERINLPEVKTGRLPKSADECVVDNQSSFQVGDVILIDAANDKDDLKALTQKEFKVVGRVTTPLYLDYQRGSTKLGDGVLEGYFYITKDAFDLDYYTGLYVNLKNGKGYFGDEANDFLDDNEKTVKKLASQINAARREYAIKEANEQLQEKIVEYEDGVEEFERSKREAYDKLDAAEAQINANAKSLAAKKKEINAQLPVLLSQREQLAAGLAQVQAAVQQMEAMGDIPESMMPQYEALKAEETELSSQLAAIDSGIAQMKAGLVQIAAGEKKLAEGRKEIAANRSRADSEFDKAERELDEAKDKLDEAKEKIEDMEAGKSYVFTRNDNVGFSVFDENASIVDGIAKIFPVFFFLIAALVCMTTMTRMIDEHRTQLGILKALGYSNAAIMSKYLFYSGSAAIIGAVIGFFAGCQIFPAVIWNAYQMMYDFNPKIDYIFNWKLALLALAVAILCSMGATWASCSSDFKEEAAQLIRPKTPKAGKRILLERIPAIWSRISFLYKVSIRNTFRYKKRFLMMVIGVSGCTALLIAGFGVNTSIKNVAKYQFDEILRYDYLVAFNNNMNEASQKDFIDYAEDKTDNKLGDVIFLHQASADIVLKDESVQVVLCATDDENIKEFINFRDGSKKLDYPGEGEAIVCREMQQRHNVEVGDTITLKDGYRKTKVKVAGVCDNYVRNYVYITQSTYENGFDKKADLKVALVRSPDGASDDEIRAASTELKKSSKVAATAVNLDTIDMVDNMMQSLNAVVILVILCAGMLAFIVLYNLTNINITERIREVATIKVLGFYDKETQKYVFRENYFLTGIAAVVGVFLGKWLLEFVMSQICVNTIFFVARLTWMDYVMSIILTFVFTAVVGFAMRKRLRNISMTESLKSIE